jgi:hypothetical protein
MYTQKHSQKLNSLVASTWIELEAKKTKDEGDLFNHCQHS